MAIYFFAPTHYHDKSFERQQSDMTLSVLQRANIAEARCVVDVGCGSGATLRHIEQLNANATLIGVDPDSDALAKGKSYGGRISFLEADGERLPLADESATHVLCRVAINYMNLDQSVREFCRVLSPGGKMVLSFIAIGYSLQQAIQPGAVAWHRRLGNVKDLAAGLLLQFTGYQGKRNTFIARSVPYFTLRGMKRRLDKLGCRIVWQQAEGHYLGFGTIWWAIIHKADAPQGQR
jgi:SAM-dependent methyltransferase